MLNRGYWTRLYDWKKISSSNPWNRRLPFAHLPQLICARQWMNDPNRMGLPDSLENLVILTYACQANRMLMLQGIAAPMSLTNLRDDIVLERQKLPEQKAWEHVCERASHIFGVTIPTLPT